MTLTVDMDWLVSHLNEPDIVIIDTRGIMPYRFGHIKNAILLGVDQCYFGC